MSYHGYGKDGYKPGPYHGRKTNLDHAREARDTQAIRQHPGSTGTPGRDSNRERRAAA